MPPTSRDRHHVQADRRADIVTKSAALFHERGYHSTSVNEIAEAVGISKPTLYHYMSGKEEILYWIHREFTEWLLDRLDQRRDVPMSYEQRILETMADIFVLMQTRPGHVRTFFEHFRELPIEQQAEIQDARDHYFGQVRAMFVEAMQAGEIRPIDPTFTTLAMFGVCNWAYQWYRPDGPMEPREIAYVMFDILSKGWRTLPS
jgi:TetR/AcrR family transcriptional regulator, cholesterol catabolism regulator